jgi:hypothetical protein
MGQNSLPIFCAGVFLSFAAHWILVQIRGGVVSQILVSVAGMLLMVAVARLLTWYRSIPELFSVSASPPRAGSGPAGPR